MRRRKKRKGNKKKKKSGDRIRGKKKKKKGNFSEFFGILMEKMKKNLKNLGWKNDVFVKISMENFYSWRHRWRHMTSPAAGAPPQTPLGGCRPQDPRPVGEGPSGPPPPGPPLSRWGKLISPPQPPQGGVKAGLRPLIFFLLLTSSSFLPSFLPFTLVGEVVPH